MPDYKENEKIEVLSPQGTWLHGKYICLSNFNDDNSESLEHNHVIECFDLDYCYIKIPNSKIRKVISK